MGKKYNLWSKKEINILKKLKGTSLIAKEIKRIYLPDRTIPSIWHRFNQLGILRPNGMKNPKIARKIGLIMKKARADPNSAYNSLKYRKKVSQSIKKVWEEGKTTGSKGIPLKQKAKKKLSIIRTKLWTNPKSYYNSKEHRKNLKKIRKKVWSNPYFREKIIKAQKENLNIKPNKPEKIMIQIIKENRFPFNYVGDWKIMINGFNPDFLSKNPKHIIEVNGDYWHNLPNIKQKDKRKLKAYASLGYKTLTIWEHELKEPERVAERIRRFIK